MAPTDEIARRVKKAATRAGKRAAEVAGKAAAEVSKTIKREVRRRRVRQALREAGKAAAAAGAAAVAAVVAEEGARAVRRRAAARSAAQPLGFEVELPLAFDAAIERVTGALQREGFGVLTRIDAHTTFQQKLNLAFRPYAILGACNPNLAYRALTSRAEVGLLLPCNVTVEAQPGGGSRVCLADPGVLLELGNLGRDPALREVAAEAREKLERVAEDLRRQGATPPQ
jgi:uncharacterized protein (DUF302 family)